MSESGDPLIGAITELRGSLDLLRTELVRKDVYDAQRTADKAEVKALVDDVREIKDTMRWLSRTLVASLALPLITAILIFFALKGGS